MDESTVDRYSRLALVVLGGGQAVDRCGDGTDAECVGSVCYPGLDDVPERALWASLGCGNPVTVADIEPGERVLDLGSGGGLDVLLSARRAGPDGMVYGVDASPDMLALARVNA